ncbi:hypothetical protein MARINOS108_140072 [Marinoscillum sp. 108]|nr:hypothetical protein MARINOS108_140072 [Marinoscillum sp. 108]
MIQSLVIGKRGLTKPREHSLELVIEGYYQGITSNDGLFAQINLRADETPAGLSIERNEHICSHDRVSHSQSLVVIVQIVGILHEDIRLSSHHFFLLGGQVFVVCHHRLLAGIPIAHIVGGTTRLLHEHHAP